MHTLLLKLLRILFLLFLFPAAFTNASAQSIIENKITEIRAAYKEINANTRNYKVIKKDSEGQSLEGGKITIYKLKGVIMKATGIYYGETGQLYTEYYFKDGKLIFVYDKDSEYDKPMYENGSKVSKVTEGRYYFDNGKMIRWLDNKGKMKPEKDFAEKEGQILAGLSEIK